MNSLKAALDSAGMGDAIRLGGGQGSDDIAIVVAPDTSSAEPGYPYSEDLTFYTINSAMPGQVNLTLDGLNADGASTVITNNGARFLRTVYEGSGLTLTNFKFILTPLPDICIPSGCATADSGMVLAAADNTSPFSALAFSPTLNIIGNTFSGSYTPGSDPAARATLNFNANQPSNINGGGLVSAYAYSNQATASSEPATANIGHIENNIFENISIHHYYPPSGPAPPVTINSAGNFRGGGLVGAYAENIPGTGFKAAGTASALVGHVSGNSFNNIFIGSSNYLYGAAYIASGASNMLQIHSINGGGLLGASALSRGSIGYTATDPSGGDGGEASAHLAELAPGNVFQDITIRLAADPATGQYLSPYNTSANVQGFNINGGGVAGAASSSMGGHGSFHGSSATDGGAGASSSAAIDVVDSAEFKNISATLEAPLIAQNASGGTASSANVKGGMAAGVSAQSWGGAGGQPDVDPGGWGNSPSKAGNGGNAGKAVARLASVRDSAFSQLKLKLKSGAITSRHAYMDVEANTIRGGGVLGAHTFSRGGNGGGGRDGSDVSYGTVGAGGQADASIGELLRTDFNNIDIQILPSPKTQPLSTGNILGILNVGGIEGGGALGVYSGSQGGNGGNVSGPNLVNTIPAVGSEGTGGAGGEALATFGSAADVTFSGINIKMGYNTDYTGTQVVNSHNHALVNIHTIKGGGALGVSAQSHGRNGAAVNSSVDMPETGGGAGGRAAAGLALGGSSLSRLRFEDISILSEDKARALSLNPSTGSISNIHVHELHGGGVLGVEAESFGGTGGYNGIGSPIVAGRGGAAGEATAFLGTLEDGDFKDVSLSLVGNYGYGGNNPGLDAFSIKGGGLIGAYSASWGGAGGGGPNYTAIVGEDGAAGKAEAGIQNVRDVRLGGNIAIETVGELMGGGLIGSYAESRGNGDGGERDASAKLGAVNGLAFNGETEVSAGTVRGGGLVGVFAGVHKALNVSPAGPGGAEALAEIVGLTNSLIKNAKISAEGDISGGAVGASAQTDVAGASATAKVTAVESVEFTELEVAGKQILGGILAVSARSEEGPASAAVGRVSESVVREVTVTAKENLSGGAVGADAQSPDNDSAAIGLIDSSLFQGVKAVSEDGDVRGGVVYSRGLADEFTIRDTIFQDNRATAANGRVYGGAVAIDTGAVQADAHTLTLTATPGRATVFQGNSVSDSSGGAAPLKAALKAAPADPANAIYFGAFAQPSLGRALLKIAPESGGHVKMYDPILVDMNDGGGKNFNMDIKGPGQFWWGGDNRMEAAAGAVTVRGGGEVTFLSQMKLDSGTIDFIAEEGGVIYIDPARPALKADFIPVDIKAARILLQDGSAIAVRPTELHDSEETVVARGAYVRLMDLTAADAQVLKESELQNGFIDVGVYKYPYELFWGDQDDTAESPEPDSLYMNLAAPLPPAPDPPDPPGPPTPDPPTVDPELGGEDSVSAPGIIGDETSRDIVRLVDRMSRDRLNAPLRDLPLGRRVWAIPTYTMSRHNGGHYRTETPSLVIGMDGRVPDGIIGGAMAFGRPTYRASWAKIQAASVAFVAYGAFRLPRDLDLSLQAGHDIAFYDQKRKVRGYEHQSDSRVNTAFIGATLAKNIALNDNQMLRPYVGYHYTSIKSRGFDEGEGFPYMLEMEKSSQNLRTLRAGTEFVHRDESSAITGSLYYQRLSGDREARTRAWLTRNPSETIYTAVGHKLDRDSLGLSLAFSGNLSEALNFTLGHTALISRNTQSHQTELVFICYW